ncbi:FMN-binding negative transcriptional regulator [Flavobacterium capsici]|uniref:FMN-binding negative transcriptional regulator n=1 Tax=Flavobacterium capsici TaxID=3075618 RepID=A0AA96J1X1_9FLAO|nr:MULTISPECIES: FMN-binding negative transcriptional regulator [unclassified Flavobacterium]WNM18852.1 FMN-binding negative transcriptional regulator [Flavobacterium sp. PMR2A8]WNM22902.1 FMN-binding negative transcriptional regulator [Flavobacterium sp. PMTSA4]
MYIPDLYKNENQTEIEKLIHENGFAVLVNQTNGKLWATHIPLLLEHKNDKQFLVGHVSKLNPQAESFKTNDDVLAIFSGSHSYISSSWYDHENVPTWNYLAVHVYGKLKLHSYEESIEALKRLVDKYEAKSENPVRVENLSEKTMREARGIVSFEIEITAIESVKKLSQNRDDKNYKNIISELEKTNDNQAIEVAKEMKKNRP